MSHPVHRRLSAPLHRLVLVLVVPLLVVACAGGGGGSPSASLIRTSAPATLVGTAWTAVAIGGQPVVAAMPPTARFSGATIEGTTGCNSYSGPYTYAAGTIKIGPLMSTLIGCDGPAGVTEQRFNTALSAATTVSNDPDGRLVLDGPGGSITFEVAGQPVGAPVQN